MAKEYKNTIDAVSKRGIVQSTYFIPAALTVVVIVAAFAVMHVTGLDVVSGIKSLLHSGPKL